MELSSRRLGTEKKIKISFDCLMTMKFFEAKGDLDKLLKEESLIVEGEIKKQWIDGKHRL